MRILLQKIKGFQQEEKKKVGFKSVGSGEQPDGPVRIGVEVKEHALDISRFHTPFG